jgi:hypothetical protein
MGRESAVAIGGRRVISNPRVLQPLRGVSLMSKIPTPSGLDGQHIAERNEAAVLARLHQYGHLRQAEIGRAVWPQSSESSGYAMAGRTLKRLVDRFYVLIKPNAVGTRSYVLAERGVARLQVEGIEAKSGSTLATAGGRFMHHSIGARYLIERAASGGTVWSEADIDASRSPVGRGELKQSWGKVPDGFAVSRGIPGAIDWIEVEGSTKSRDEIARILNLSRYSGTWLNAAESVKLGRVVVVYDHRSSMGHETAFIAGLKRLRAKLSEREKRQSLEALVFVRCEIEYPLSWRSHEEIGAATVLARAGERRSHRKAVERKRAPCWFIATGELVSDEEWQWMDNYELDDLTTTDRANIRIPEPEEE